MPKRGGRKGPKKSKEEKVKERIKNMIEKTQRLQEIKEKEANLLKIQQEQLQSLLKKSSQLNGSKLKHEIKSIARTYKDSVRNNRNKRKQKLQIRREQRRREKEEIRKRKQEFYNSINSARIITLPIVTQSNILNISIDGWNILSCDSECRKQIRKNKQVAISIFCTLLNQFMSNKHTLNINYNININCLFDGNGKNKKDENINIIFTGKGISVDDMLVDKFNKIEDKNDIKNNIVITSDRELTFRLYKTGVKVMKSSVFYKLIMNNINKIYGNNTNNKNNNKIVEEEKEDQHEDDIDDELAKRIAMKMNLHSDEDDNNNNNNKNKNNNNNNNNNNINNPTDIMEQDDNGDNYTFNDNDEFDEIFDENMDDIDDED